MTITDPAAQRRPRLKGDERAELRKALAAKYRTGSSIRELLAEYGLSYGLTHTLLLEEGVTLRARSGGRKPRP
ncbi:helix-turn-helix domain-containing protein [Streptomyces sp. BH104]|uniref:helix-turn-helix domain-containing protein n=1 Tax=Streptomyces sp. BH104 TaxID=3410407 RepID=UPI003BB56EEE